MSSSFSTSLVTCLLLSTGLLLVALCQHILRRHQPAARRHTGLIGAVLVIPLLPLLLQVPVVRLYVLAPGTEPIAPLVHSAVTYFPAELPSSAAWFALLVYATGVLLALARLALSWAYLHKMKRQGVPIDNAMVVAEYGVCLGRADLRECRSLATPLTFGFFRQTILVPQRFFNGSETTVKAVLRHELAHIARSDWLLQMLSAIVFALLWFHPLVPFVRRTLGLTAELAADDQVLLEGMSRSDYAEQILHYAHNGREAAQPQLALATAFNRPGSRQKTRVFAALACTRRQRSDRSKVIESCAVNCLAVLALSSIEVAAVPASNWSLPAAGHTITEIAPPPRYGAPLICGLTGGNVHQESVWVQPPDITKGDRQYNNATPPLAGTAVNHRHRWHQDYLAQRPELRVAARFDPFIEVRGMTPKRSVFPVYPKRALRRNIEGVVVVEFDIDASGGVHAPRIVRARPARIFNRAAIAAVSQYQYVRNGNAAEISNVQNTFVFQLADKTRKQDPAAEPEFDGATMIARGSRNERYK